MILDTYRMGPHTYELYSEREYTSTPHMEKFQVTIDTVFGSHSATVG